LHKPFPQKNHLGWFHPIPILFLTASTKPEIVDAIRALKGARYLAKPISSDGLTDMLEQLLRADVAH